MSKIISKVKIIFENEYEIVIDKPADIMTHTDNRKEEDTLVDWLFKHLSKKESEELKNVGEKGREGVVHRLDTGTTGVMIFAKNNEAFNFLKKQFQNHNVKKIYHAIVIGHIKNDTGIIDEAISRSRSDFRKKNIKNPFDRDGKGNVRGKERNAITRYKVIARLKSKNNNKYTFVECYPETGRTHQIRVHFKSIRHPIIGDNLYGPREIKREKIQKDFETKLSRPMLHSFSLKIKILEKDKETNKIFFTEKTFIAKEHLDMRKILNEMEYKI